jgi:hypothetical protein
MGTLCHPELGGKSRPSDSSSRILRVALNPSRIGLKKKEDRTHRQGRPCEKMKKRNGHFKIHENEVERGLVRLF